MYEFFMSIITHPAFGFASAGIGFLIGHYLTRARSFEAIRLTEFNKAAATFYAAFLDDIIIVEDNIISKEIRDRLRERERNEEISKIESYRIRHRKAMIMFRPYIDKSDLAGFDDAWSKYHYWVKHYTDEKNTDEKYDFKFHLDALLKYAVPK